MPESWSTVDEIKYLEGLGTHRQGSPETVEKVPRELRLELLLNYRQSMRLRANWAGIDRILVGGIANEMIEKVRGGT
ncbi:MAG: hypothetical protein UT07_C0016G0004 [Parcubacteria group bacterium GW2011_GWB1_38_8]|uniref:Uncharacterized protein n=1 Tax=Candidatus Zambryskibacteria bacterium RIFCSPLOWO2_02_FULL_39_14 TaxID=1802769 RepID=A0A1G2UI32_9BACT|nr:MAG: hypothetical protein UT07_C0016G0004 [Parcubacteria group bacterium GW2011_GWB1_38_8]KKR30418.1 MAG: hypothetical protein UT62_C0013G0003 [Parcubacteria group bacterium GW2011_GWC1_39_8]OHA96036.1 MAG: hypothetical protein A3C62_02735 [Candidatus Zambryskibacteria bacterium RIFCSPHIGHO2_02_FULL_39_16]OHB09099.1 MAG: hypothetical protein A3I86_02815 [Candidatus Zambryskibacteria bacterium RIFCSPLOWO2_02_FULL_39_14]